MGTQQEAAFYNQTKRERVAVTLYDQTAAVTNAAETFASQLWTALQCAGLKDADLVTQFGIVIDQIADEREGSDVENTLWHAAAMKWLPQDRFAGPDRVIMTRKLDAAYRAFADAFHDDQVAQAIDFKSDASKDAA